MLQYWFHVSLGKMGEGLFIARMQLDVKDYQSPECSQQLTLPPPLDPVLKALQLTEALRAVLEGQGNEEGQDTLRKQVSDDTADIILKWLGRGGVSTDSQVCHPSITVIEHLT